MENVKVFAKTIEKKAEDQINLLASQPAFRDAKIRIMPDVHAGAGCVIGFTADMGDKVIPNVVGVDIGCGMLCARINAHAGSDALKKIDEVIRKNVPCGFSVHDEPIASFDALKDLYAYEYLRDMGRIECSFGTLGGGNHFIELDIASDLSTYLVIHTGSRNLGKQIADLYQRLAIDTMNGKKYAARREQELIATLKADGRQKDIASSVAALRESLKSGGEIGIPNDLAFLTGEHRLQYLHDMLICQSFASENRAAIAKIISDEMGWTIVESFQTIHNYIDYDSNIVRKGAVSAMLGERLIIPMNMRDGSLICTGKGNDDWNQSAPHGAGRIMSRTQARETLLLDDFKAQMDGIYSTSICGDTIDEAPMAYKPMQEIIDAIGDTVEINDRLIPIYNFKAADR